MSVSVLTLATRKRSMREEVLDWFKVNQSGTADDCEAALQLPHQSCSARIHDLEVSGYLIRTKGRKVTRSGKTASIYRISPDLTM